ncbi:ParB-like chromosome segregation protein Spo0J [Streptomyces sp. 1114.5]|uniref:ParB/RepB/Spo0J family partition protein n=1 Tax=unclassified Streptomyces TaxID=2593676 RepID=UPI000BCC0DA2|nr:MULTISPECIES: ParB N-terminal domain-containing protein [unclassified Streptomyces]RKT11395.1 ParB-like chromosome segregation protein Spo0J [Streptomyces sp. 1114.5]SOB81243.1 Chromosome segregation protein Spo0J, contains ParB-like nuclease domain [Streptomyces sp. 1331.2]
MTDVEAIHTRTRNQDSGPPGLDLAGTHQADIDVGAEVRWIPIADLVLSDSPRTAGEDSEHARTLAELGSGAELPPIIVQRGTNRVVDGRHRVRAAQLRGEREIRACFFDGDDPGAFVLAVRLNVRHGLPLSLADRKAAVRRILAEHDTWSNRAIAAIAGLSPKTVAAVRAEAGQPAGQARVGRDGRVRPVDAAAGRERVREILAREPNSSLRAVSAVAGVSVGTVRSVRDQLRHQLRERGAPPAPALRATVPARYPEAPPSVPVMRATVPLRSAEMMLNSLRTDPSLRFNQSGRLLLSILAVAAMDPDACERLIADLPDHCLHFVSELAMVSMQGWQELAVQLERRRSAPLTSASVSDVY